MTRRVIVIPSQATEERPAFDSWLPGRGLLQESVALAGIVFVAGEMLLLGITYLVMPLADAALATLAAAPVVAALAALVALVLALYRVLRFERRERRHMALLDAQVEAAWRELQEAMPAARVPTGGIRDDRYWDRLAYEILRRYYATLARTRSREAAARAISRDVCVQAGLCNQKEWNVVNQLLVKRGIRAGRKRYLRPRTFDEAWRIWQEKSAGVHRWIFDEQGDMIPQE